MYTYIQKIRSVFFVTNVAYTGSVLETIIKKQRNSPDNYTQAIFTDIDDTLYKTGHERAMAEFIATLQERSIPLIAVTGNDFVGVRDRTKAGQLPYFAAIIGSVGTEIWFLHENSKGKKYYKQDKEYKKQLDALNFDRPALIVQSKKLIAELAKTKPEWKFDFQIPEREMKEGAKKEQWYQPFKISFFFYAEADAVEDIQVFIKSQFPNLGVVVCEEIWYTASHRKDIKIKKYCVDVVPVTKRHAVEHVCKTTGITKGIVAGDSGNDLEMLIETANLNAVLVGGHTDFARSVADNASQVSQRKRNFRHIYTQKGKLRKILFVDQNPDRIAASSLLFAFKSFERMEILRQVQSIASIGLFRTLLLHSRYLSIVKILLSR